MSEKVPSKHDHWPATLSATGGGFLCVYAVGIFGYQCFLWLKNGYWTSFEMRMIWNWIGESEQINGWRGVQKILSLLLDCPMSVGLFIIGIIIAIIGTMYSGEESSKYLAYQRQQKKLAESNMPSASTDQSRV